MQESRDFGSAAPVGSERVKRTFEAARQASANRGRSEARADEISEVLNRLGVGTGSVKWVFFGPAYIPEPVAVAVAYHVDSDGYLTSFVFAPTSAGVVDLVGFHIDHAESDQWAEDRAVELMRLAANRLYDTTTWPTLGLTSRQVRAAAAQKGLLAEARKVVREVLGETLFEGRDVRRPVRGAVVDDAWYATLVVEYAALAADGRPGARARLAAARHASETTVRNWISEATRRGLYATSGPGKPGQPTQRAYELAQEEPS